ncbi:MAG: YihY/virulence factor BrkB family protein [Candidatus Pseudobacter hemicellulosilyticus]|uniref:YihY/virulence factor BrkB family protein n=1 Tax=Candidatus Pseudobacter hemicellulosilyticus TaxID=3121375 RepID=A0AAJ5WWY3_9BACT|nr:MAG: YihY/virulence factor BrkB family protein [Pseudobacter sp.]
MAKQPLPIRRLGLLRKALREFQKNDPLRMAGATAFFATFALPAILIILIQVFGLILDRRTLGSQLLNSLSEVIGQHSATQLRETLRNVRQLAHTWYIAAGLFLFLVFVSTTLFKVIKDSLNQLWRIKLNKAGFRLQLRARAKSFVAIMIAGILFLLALLAEGLFALLRKYFAQVLPQDNPTLNVLISQLVSLGLVTIWFTLVFRYLADGHTTLKVTLVGGLFTGILFTMGKFVLGFFLSYSNMQNIYGTSTSFVLLLLFIFYCSIIFYYGACFTKVWAEFKKRPILPGRHAGKYQIADIEELTS